MGAQSEAQENEEEKKKDKWRFFLKGQYTSVSNWKELGSNTNTATLEPLIFRKSQ